MNVFPLVTVIVPAYNHEKYVNECLESIYNQTYKDFQWIVVDDGSKDRTPSILKDNQEKYGYDLIVQENHGLSWTLTNIIKNHAKGKYISICASDDKWLPRKLELQLRFMEASSEYAMCYGRTMYMNQSSIVTAEDNPSLYKSGDIFEPILFQEFHPPVNYMYKKSAIEAVGYFPTGIIAEDYYMNCKLSECYKIGYIDDFLTIYREAPLQTKRDPLELMNSHRDTITLYRGLSMYNQALSLHNLRCFNVLGGFIKYKFTALNCLLKVRIKDILHNKILLLKGIYHFVLFWRTV